MQRGPISETGGKEQETQQESKTLNWQYHISHFSQRMQFTQQMTMLICTTFILSKHWENGSNWQSYAKITSVSC